MSATMLKLIEPANPLSEGFTIEQCFNLWGPGCKAHPNELRLVEYNAYVPEAPYRPMLQCRVCGEVYGVEQATVIPSEPTIDEETLKNRLWRANEQLVMRNNDLIAERSRSNALVEKLAKVEAERLSIERELTVLRVKVAEYAASAKLSAQEADRDIASSESSGYDKGYHACMQTLADWLREYIKQERDGEPSIHRFDDRIAMELFFYGESDYCKENGGLS